MVLEPGLVARRRMRQRQDGRAVVAPGLHGIGQRRLARAAQEMPLRVLADQQREPDRRQFGQQPVDPQGRAFGARRVVAARAAARVAEAHRHDREARLVVEGLGVDAETFYDETRFAIVPMGFCYPGRGASGDNPPRPECAPLWIDRLLAELPSIRLTLLIGQYAQRHFLRGARKATLTDTVQAWRDYGPAVLPLPHPSPRNQAWFKHHPWFDAEVVPELRRRIAPLAAG
ncbi:uracil-DNA glycosylase family protein [Burkholderia cenocepacia]|uniref:uracil-DNA glycosylase family protein n=1 Tax=Burkholderia cenocepacia TaxID=95486 RepID=UPI003F49C48A